MNIDLFGNVIVDELVEPKKSSISPFDFINNIAKKTRPESTEEYNAYITNLAFSQRKDTAILANEMNKYYNLNNDCQFDFFFHTLPAKNLFAKWSKKENIENIDAVKEYYNVSERVAQSYMKVLTNAQVDEIVEFIRTRKGGKNK